MRVATAPRRLRLNEASRSRFRRPVWSGQPAQSAQRESSRRGARWIACTDADTVVAPDWLAAQLGLDADVVCGTVSVDDWSHHGPAVRRLYSENYLDADGHRHVHGANLGIATHAYERAGGFLPFAFDEDVALVRALQAIGANIAWSAAPRVTTSARAESRAPSGFACHLTLLAAG